MVKTSFLRDKDSLSFEQRFSGSQLQEIAKREPTLRSIVIERKGRKSRTRTVLNLISRKIWVVSVLPGGRGKLIDGFAIKHKPA